MNESTHKNGRDSHSAANRQRVTVHEVHALTGADIDGLRRLPGYDPETDTLAYDPGSIFAEPPKPGPPQPPVGLDRRHG